MNLELEGRRYSLSDLLTMMERLRDPADGCPWDLEQTPKTIINYSIEEVYELAEVVESTPLDYKNMKDELGDLLLQTVFFSQFASEAAQFSFHDVVHHLCAKMIRRHPHVFPGGVLESRRAAGDEIDTGQVRDTWAAIKKHEKSDKRSEADIERDLFRNIPERLPALMRAGKFQKRAAKIGLDWADAGGALEKLEEEIEELKLVLSERSDGDVPAIAPENDALIEDELGDILFSVVNVARKLDKDPEQLLRAAICKFALRANDVASKLDWDSDMEDQLVVPEILDKLWVDAKKRFKT